MSALFKRTWWAVLVRGIIAILFGILLFAYPGLTLATGAISFVILFVVFTLIDGVVMIVGALQQRSGQWIWLLVLGIVSILAGIIALGNPILFATFTVILMVYIVAFRALIGGVLEIIAGWQLRQDIAHEWLLILGGIVSVLFGVILLIHPIAAIETLVLIVGFYALIIGVMQVILAFNMRGSSNALTTA